MALAKHSGIVRFKCKRNRSICAAVSLLRRIHSFRSFTRDSRLFHALFFCSRSPLLAFRWSWSLFVCLFVQFPFSVCISLIYTDKSISVPLRTHYVLGCFQFIYAAFVFCASSGKRMPEHNCQQSESERKQRSAVLSVFSKKRILFQKCAATLSNRTEPNQTGLIFATCIAMSYNILSFVLMANLF